MHVGLFHCDLPQRDRKVGGVPMAVHGLANALAQNPSDRVTVFSLDDPPPESAYRHVRLFPGMPWLASSKIARLLLLPALLNSIDLDDVDLLHLHGDDWFYLDRKTRSVRTFHGSALREAQSSTSFTRCAMQYTTYALEKLSALLADMSLAVGEDARLLYNADRTIDNGINLQLFHPGPKADHPLILFVGTWAGRKRGEFLARQFSQLVLPRIPTAELVMVTDHCEPGPAVRWVKSPDDAALAELYRSAWAFAYPSIYEGFGIPYVEAMASGTAVLASPNPGASHVLQGGEAGLIVDDRSFGAQLCRLLLDPDVRLGYERRGMARAQTFSWQAVADVHRKIYQAVLAR